MDDMDFVGMRGRKRIVSVSAPTPWSRCEGLSLTVADDRHASSARKGKGVAMGVSLAVGTVSSMGKTVFTRCGGGAALGRSKSS